MATTPDQFTDGEAYERLMGRWSRLVGRQFLDWIKVPKGKAWLDVGCGNGAFTEEICKIGKPSSVVGLDPAEAQLAYARTRTALKAVSFHVGDAQALPFEDAQFDVAVMALAISFVPDASKAVSELARVTRSGGTVATYMWDLPGGGLPLAPIYRAFGKMQRLPPMPSNAAVSQMEALQSLWHEADLTSVETTVLKIDVAFDNFDDFWESNTLRIGPQGKFMDSLDATIIEQLRLELKATMPLQADGRIVYGAFANAVKGKKRF
jgi:ubiquinone/menaquinone biosynthesis C-methylase UbiE